MVAARNTARTAKYAVPWWYRGPCPAWRDVEAFWRGQPPDPCPEWRATVGSLQESLLQQLAFDEVTRPRRLADEQSLLWLRMESAR